MIGRRLLALALALSAAAPAMAQPADPVVEQAVEALRPIFGQDQGEGVAIESARAEGRMLIVVMRLPPALNQAMTPTQLTANFVLGMCEDAAAGRSFFDAGRAVRVDRSVDGRIESGAAFDHCATSAEAQLTAASYAAAMQPRIGTVFEGGIRLAGARAEGDTLIITIDGPAGWRGHISAAQTERSFLGGFCGDPEAEGYFASGQTIRLETLDDGRSPRLGAPIRTCPGR